MKNILRKGLVIVGVYVLFVGFLLMASKRIQRLEENTNNEKSGVALINFE